MKSKTWPALARAAGMSEAAYRAKRKRAIARGKALSVAKQIAAATPATVHDGRTAREWATLESQPLPPRNADGTYTIEAQVYVDMHTLAEAGKRLVGLSKPQLAFLRDILNAE